jgi:hypothetical protein
MFGDDRQRPAQLLKHDLLRFDAVPLLEPDIAHLGGHHSGRAIVLMQDRLEHLRANRVAPPSDIEGKLRSQERTLSVPAPCHCGHTKRRCGAAVIGSTWFKRLPCSR